MYYIYVLQSLKDKEFYTGFTSELEERLKKHNDGLVTSTKHRRPFNLVYFEASLHKTDALHREIYLKTAWGKRYIKTRIRNYLMRKKTI
jgi:putative endonuclease